jgi:hypothetical protein
MDPSGFILLNGQVKTGKRFIRQGAEHQAHFPANLIETRSKIYIYTCTVCGQDEKTDTRVYAPHSRKVTEKANVLQEE